MATQQSAYVLIVITTVFLFYNNFQRREDCGGKVLFRWKSSGRSRKIQTQSPTKGSRCEIFLSCVPKPMMFFSKSVRGCIQIVVLRGFLFIVWCIEQPKYSHILLFTEGEKQQQQYIKKKVKRNLKFET